MPPVPWRRRHVSFYGVNNKAAAVVYSETECFTPFMDDIFIILLLIILNGVFSMSEIAVISARKSRLNADAKQGSKGALAALRLANDPDRFLSTIQIGITLIGILTGLFSGAALADDVGALLQRIGLQPRTAHTVGQIVIVAVVTYLSIVVGELVPKRIGLAAATPAAKLVARPMNVLSWVALPAVWLLSVSTSMIVKIIGLKSGDNNVTEDEIKSLIKDGTDSGEVRKVEQDIMERALVLGDLRVAAIMTPKMDVVAMQLDMTAADVRRVLSEELHTSYPVYCDASHKSVCGVVSLKQLVLSLDSPDFLLCREVSEPEYFPESMSVYDALEKMKSGNVRFALVCDEFGDIAGVITPADILEGLVGALSRQMVASDAVEKESDGVWIFGAQIQFYDFLNRLGLEDLYRPASYSTLGGFILDELRHVPAVGETYEWNRVLFEIASMKGARIEKVRVRLMPQL